VTVQGSGEEVDGSITSFGYNNPTEISGLSIFSSGNVGSGNVATLSRIGDFNLNFNVYDIDGFRHLDVYVVLYNDGVRNLDSGVTATYINSGVRDNALVIRWLAPERALYLSGLTEDYEFAIDSNEDNFLVKSGTEALDSFYSSGLEDFVTPTEFNAQENVSWVVYSGSSVVTDSGTVSVFNASGVETSSGNRVLRRNVTIPIKMSKVAPTSGVWNYAVYVFDRLQQEITQPKTNIVEPHYLRATTDYTNQWYGEIEVDQNSLVQFPSVQAGSGFSRSSGVITVRFTSNGEYSQLVNTDTTWQPNSIVPGRPLHAYLVPSSGLTSNESLLTSQGNRFALQARRVTLAGDGSATTDVDLVLDNVAELVPAATSVNSGIYMFTRTGDPIQSKIVEISTAPLTTEIGVVSTFDFQIRLSRVFQTIHAVNDTEQTTIYTGNIYLGISNSDTPGTFFNTNE
jgi:hypothetical protein